MTSRQDHRETARLGLHRIAGFTRIAVLTTLVLGCSSEGVLETGQTGNQEGSPAGPSTPAQPATPDTTHDTGVARVGSVRILHAAKRHASLSTRERLSSRAQELTVQEFADGTARLELHGRLHQASVVRVNSNGRLERGCVDSPRALDAWLSADAAPTQLQPDGTP